ncbi:hypothetical protein BB561_002659 [Smittium simulii]|uniref:GPI transamidase component PIG-S n=1 Tax=Smittium simulii TaxID=133385 RepID=A0A2T9YPT0_9FUNG|nr:hypothetical protein BB561_002659 [Smittium simulii]
MNRLSKLFKKTEKPIVTVLSAKAETYVTLATIFVFIIIGLPLWHYTTSIYRATIPTEDIKHLTEKFSITQPINLLLDFSGIQDQQTAFSISENTKTEINKNSSFYKIIPKSKRPAFGYVTNVLSTVDKNFTLDNVISKEIDMKFKLILDDKLEKPKFIISQDGQISIYFNTLQKDDIALKMAMFYNKILNSELKLLKKTAYYTSRQKSTWDRLAELKFSPEFLINFSLILEGSSAHRYDWKIEESIKDYLQPFIDSINDLTTIKVTSQIQHSAALEESPKLINGSHVLELTSLTNFINSAQWNFASTIPETSSIQMVMFIPSAEKTPLYLLDSKGQKSLYNSFLLPQWGGIVVNNHIPKSMELDSLSIDGVEIVDENSFVQGKSLTFWEHRYLQTKYTILNAADSISTLGSLVELTKKIQSMAISDNINKKVVNAVDFLNRMGNKNVQIGSESFFLSVMANKLSSEAFFDPTMVGMVYFPIEHKYAIYTPLFLPLALPIISILIKMKKDRKLRQKTKKTNDENQEKEIKSHKEKDE